MRSGCQLQCSIQQVGLSENCCTRCPVGSALSSACHRSLVGLKRKAGFKATDKKGVATTTGDALRAAVAAVAQFSATVSESLASTYR
jgi:hypothetical protein